MTRVNSKRRNKRKNNDLGKILALALALGISGTATSYAYFSARAEATSNLKINTGTLNLDLNCFEDDYRNTVNITNLKPSLKDDCECESDGYFTIRNSGTLKEKIKISLKFFEDDYNGILNFISGSLVFKDGNKDISKPMELKSFNNNNFVEVLDLDNKPLIIEPGKEIKGVFKVSLKNSVDYKYENKDFEFSITARGTQVNNKNWK